MPSVPDVAEVATAVLEDVGSTELEPLADVDPATLLPAVPAQMTAAEPVTAGAVAAPPPEPVAEAPAEAASEIRPSPDPPAAPTVEQTAPTNVNVSIRIDSPGDNGEVTQTNAAAETEPQYQPEPPQYQEPIPATAIPDPGSTPDPSAPPETEPADGEWNWTWSWNCGDSIPELPVGSDVALQNWTWNWDWNCGDEASTTSNVASKKAPQYQPVRKQYRPVNINISIRINSPGNDGPVIQTNVAVIVTPPVLPSVFPGAQLSEVATVEAAVSAALQVEGSLETSTTPPEQSFDSDDCCVLPRPGGVATAAPEAESVVLPQAPPTQQRDITARGRFRAAVAVTARIAEASTAATRAARPVRQRVRTVRPAPRRPAAPTRPQVAALSAAGFAPLNAPDSRQGYLMLLIAGIAFAISLADASRPVAAEVRAAGEDPDPPPDRPG